LTPIAAKLYYQSNMALPDKVHQVIEQIINLTEGVTPDMRQPLYDELREQFEALLTQTILMHLDDQQTQQFNELLKHQPAPIPSQIQSFLDQVFPSIDPIFNQAVTMLKQQYLED
jgi:hypothetical protein